MPTDIYPPGVLLETIGRELYIRGLDVRERYHDSRLIEIVVTIPRHDGLVTWDCRREIDSRYAIETIRDKIIAILASDLADTRSRAGRR